MKGENGRQTKRPRLNLNPRGYPAAGGMNRQMNHVPPGTFSDPSLFDEELGAYYPYEMGYSYHMSRNLNPGTKKIKLYEIGPRHFNFFNVTSAIKKEDQDNAQKEAEPVEECIKLPHLSKIQRRPPSKELKRNDAVLESFWPNWVDPHRTEWGSPTEPQLARVLKEFKMEQKQLSDRIRQCDEDVAVDSSQLKFRLALYCGDGWRRDFNPNEKTVNLHWKFSTPDLKPIDPRL
jgi:hypothetical protein